MNYFSKFSTSYFWSVGFIFAGLVGTIPSILLLTSKSYRDQYLVNLRAYYSDDYSSYRPIFADSRTTRLWVKKIGPEKFLKLSRTTLAPLGIILGFLFIVLGLYLATIHQ